jgi:vacuolar iron transporter family protein
MTGSRGEQAPGAEGISLRTPGETELGRRRSRLMGLNVASRPDRAAPRTRLGRAVGATAGIAAAASTPSGEHHRHTNSLRDVILGGQDGLVNILGIILGVIAGGGSQAVLLSAGFAAAITESISMGAVGYTSSVAERDYYEAERERELAEVETMPAAEREEIRDIYASKGFTGELLERVVETITANRETWLSTMMDEELHLQPVQRPDILRSSVVITVATLVGHLIPLVPFLVVPRTPALVLAIALSAAVLFGVGVYSAVTLVGDWRRSGMKMVVIGLGAAAVGFLVARLFHAAGA